MAIRTAFLIALLSALLPGGNASATAAEPAACMRCHPVHYAAQGACVACHRGNQQTSRENLAHERLLSGAAAAWGMPASPAIAEGERLRDRLGCRRCHVTGGSGNTYAISLDHAAWKRTQLQLRRALLEPATFMPDFALSEAQADALIGVLLRDGERSGTESRYMVRFRDSAPARVNAFAAKCGPCHRALTPAGPLGTSNSGPNLSGLLSGHYPDPAGRVWDEGRLERWLRNPRSERPSATMRPVALDSTEWREVREALGPAPQR